MKKFSFTILVLTIILCDANSQIKEIHLGNGQILIERLTLSEADDKKVEILRTVQTDKKISDSWRIDDFRTKDKRLEKDYERIIKGLRKKGIKFKELNRQEFNNQLSATADKEVYYLTNDYTVREENNLLIITMTFKLLSNDKTVIIDDSSKGILKQISVE